MWLGKWIGLLELVVLRVGVLHITGERLTVSYFSRHSVPLTVRSCSMALSESHRRDTTALNNSSVGLATTRAGMLVTITKAVNSMILSLFYCSDH